MKGVIEAREHAARMREALWDEMVRLARTIIETERANGTVIGPDFHRLEDHCNVLVRAILVDRAAQDRLAFMEES